MIESHCKHIISSCRHWWVPWDGREVTVRRDVLYENLLCACQCIPADFPGVLQVQKEKGYCETTCSWQLGSHPRCNNMSQWGVSPQQSTFNLWLLDTLWLVWLAKAWTLLHVLKKSWVKRATPLKSTLNLKVVWLWRVYAEASWTLTWVLTLTPQSIY